MSSVPQESEGGQLAFDILRALMIGYQLWGIHSRWHLDDLCRFLGASEALLGVAVDELDGAGVVRLDRNAGTVRLTRSGAHQFLTGSVSERLSLTSPTVGGVC